MLLLWQNGGGKGREGEESGGGERNRTGAGEERRRDQGGEAEGTGCE